MGAVAQLTSLDFIVQVLVIGALLYIIMHLARSIWRTSRQPTVVPARPMVRAFARIVVLSSLSVCATEAAYYPPGLYPRGVARL